MVELGPATVYGPCPLCKEPIPYSASNYQQNGNTITADCTIAPEGIAHFDAHKPLGEPVGGMSINGEEL